MSPEAWVFFGTNTGLLIKGYFDNRKGNKTAEKAVTKASQAVDNTRNISNGFAKGIKDDLNSLHELILNNNDVLMRHLENHGRMEREKRRDDHTKRGPDAR